MLKCDHYIQGLYFKVAETFLHPNPKLNIFSSILFTGDGANKWKESTRFAIPG